jgi:hypothetical protein
VPISPIRTVERREIHHTDSINHEQREMVIRQPIPHIRRHQKHLLTIR